MARKKSPPPAKAEGAKAKKAAKSKAPASSSELSPVSAEPSTPAVTTTVATTSVPLVQAALSSPPEPATGPGARKQERVAFEGTVDVRGVFAGPLAGVPRAQNVSLGGVFVETAHLLEVGDPVVLSFSDDRGGRLSVSGRVRWVTPFGRVSDPTPGMGIEFVGVDDVKRDKLDALLKKRAS